MGLVSYWMKATESIWVPLKFECLEIKVTNCITRVINRYLKLNMTLTYNGSHYKSSATERSILEIEIKKNIDGTQKRQNPHLLINSFLGNKNRQMWSEFSPKRRQVAGIINQVVSRCRRSGCVKQWAAILSGILYKRRPCRILLY